LESDGDAPEVLLWRITADGGADGRQVVRNMAMGRCGLRPVILHRDEDAAKERSDGQDGQNSE